MPDEIREEIKVDESEKKDEALPASSPFAKRISTATRVKESAIKYFFLINSATALIFIILIFIFLFKEGIQALDHIGLMDFIYQSKDSEAVYQWYPTSENPRFSLVPLILGTLLTSIPATIISTIFGIGAGIFLAEIAQGKTKEILNR